MITPEVPRRGPVWQPILHDQPDGEGNHPVRVMTPWGSHIGQVGVEIHAAVGAVMLRIDEVKVVGPPRRQIPHVVKPPGEAPQAVGSSAAPRARETFVVAATSDDSRCRQALNMSDSLCHVGKVFTGSGHDRVLQGISSSLGYTGKFWLSRPEKLCIFATVSEKPSFGCSLYSLSASFALL